MRALGQILLFIILVVGAGAILRAIASAAFPGIGSPSRSSGRSGRAMRSPAPRAVRTAGRSAIAAAVHPTNSQIRTQARADAKRAWTEVKATDWIEQRRHDREHGTATATRPTIRQRLRLAPFAPPAQASAGGNGQNGNGANGNGGGASGSTQPGGTNATRPADGTEGPAPPPKAPSEPAQPTSTTGGTTVAGTSTASAEKLIEGINEIYAHAATGGIHAKQEAAKAAHEACVRFAAMSQMLARAMAEPGSNYGPEITEPCSKAGQHLQAAAMAYSEADAALSTLINMTVGDLATSPRQAPHHTELTEAGAH